MPCCHCPILPGIRFWLQRVVANLFWLNGCFAGGSFQAGEGKRADRFALTLGLQTSHQMIGHGSVAGVGADRASVHASHCRVERMHGGWPIRSRIKMQHHQTHRGPIVASPHLLGQHHPQLKRHWWLSGEPTPGQSFNIVPHHASPERSPSETLTRVAPCHFLRLVCRGRVQPQNISSSNHAGRWDSGDGLISRAWLSIFGCCCWLPSIHPNSPSVNAQSKAVTRFDRFQVPGYIDVSSDIPAVGLLASSTLNQPTRG